MSSTYCERIQQCNEIESEKSAINYALFTAIKYPNLFESDYKKWSKILNIEVSSFDELWEKLWDKKESQLNF
jgi:hypothetical protein